MKGNIDMKIPNQRRPGQGGNTNHGHRSNRLNSMSRGGNPHVGGAGGGRKAGGGGCLPALLYIFALPPVAAMIAELM